MTLSSRKLGFGITAALVFAAFSSVPAVSSSLTTLHAFCAKHQCADGDNTNGESPLVEDSLGNFYGMTPSGGKRGGTVFELSLDAVKGQWILTTLYGFPKDKHGAEPEGRLIVGQDGSLYGTTASGGKPGAEAGVVFRLKPNADRTNWRPEVLYTFCPDGTTCPDGARPLTAGLSYVGAESGIAYDGSSPLFGTTILGGKNNKGVVYELDFDQAAHQWKETVIHDFCNVTNGAVCVDGSEPGYGVTIDADGNIFGTAPEGPNSTGIIYEVSPLGGGNWQYTVLYNFCGAIPCAAFPKGGLIRDAQGNFLGTSDGGNHAHGVIFKLIPNGSNSQLVDLYDFCSLSNCSDGKDPEGGLAMDSSGNLFGTTRYGGTNDSDPTGQGGGTVFVFGNGTLQTLYNFCGAKSCKDGNYPLAGVTLDGDGNIFGTTQAGGAHAAGTAFELTANPGKLTGTRSHPAGF
ncbi:MAG: hypothetical protein JO261_16470 [Alphaproteobacteria bacterium]|nr:hypothetical protein [Alphaproteobacteria bacterium]MBV9695288.1 hypothetical protein [Alphaproteobacteria bacterium]